MCVCVCVCVRVCVAVLWDGALNLWDLTLSPGSVRIESNCKTPSWCRRELLGVRKSLRVFGDQKYQK